MKLILTPITYPFDARWRRTLVPVISHTPHERNTTRAAHLVTHAYISQDREKYKQKIQGYTSPKETGSTAAFKILAIAIAYLIIYWVSFISIMCYCIAQSIHNFYYKDWSSGYIKSEHLQYAYIPVESIPPNRRPSETDIDPRD